MASSTHSPQASANLAAKQSSQAQEIVGAEVERPGLRTHGFPARSIFERPMDIGCSESSTGRGFKIGWVRRHHHALFWRQRESTSCTKVCFARRLVRACHVAPEDYVSWQPSALCEVDG